MIIALVALKAAISNGAGLHHRRDPRQPVLATGVAFFLGGVRNHTQEYNPGATRLYSSMMLIAAISLAVPSAFNRFFSPEGTIPQEKIINLGTALVLLATYGLYLVFMLKTHPEFFNSAGGKQEGHEHEGAQWSGARGIGSLLGASVLAAWMSEILVGAAEGTGKALGMSEVFIGIVFLAIVGGAAESGSAIAMARKTRWT